MIEYLNKSHADDIDRMKMEMELTTGSLKNDHQRMIASLEEEHAKTVKELQDSLDGVRAENVELREAVSRNSPLPDIISNAGSNFLLPSSSALMHSGCDIDSLSCLRRSQRLDCPTTCKT